MTIRRAKNQENLLSFEFETIIFLKNYILNTLCYNNIIYKTFLEAIIYFQIEKQIIK